MCVQNVKPNGPAPFHCTVSLRVAVPIDVVPGAEPFNVWTIEITASDIHVHNLLSQYQNNLVPSKTAAHQDDTSEHVSLVGCG